MEEGRGVERILSVHNGSYREEIRLAMTERRKKKRRKRRELFTDIKKHTVIILQEKTSQG